jgi:hypothetical protein
MEHGQAMESLLLTFRRDGCFIQGYFIPLFRLLLNHSSALHLSKLAIHGSWYSGDTIGRAHLASDFINSQKSSLTHLILRPTSYDGLEWLTNIKQNVDLPNLRILELDARNLFPWPLEDKPGPYFGLPRTHNIATLKLDTFYQPKELHPLILDIGKELPRLNELSLATTYLVPHTIDLLEKNFTVLQSLQLKIEGYGTYLPKSPSGLDETWTSDVFIMDKVHNNWKLTSLGVFRLCPTCKEIYPVKDLLKLLAECIPSVESLDERDSCRCLPHF